MSHPQPRYYRNLDEKKEFFTQVRIDTNKDFEDLFKVILPQKESKGGIWRGQTESSFKLYNTFQRKNLISKTPVENVINYIDGLLTELNNWDKRDVIGKYFRNYGVKSVPIYAKLSILRHYEIPSPLLDWTRNPRVALYFATLHRDEILEEEGIDNYFSIYFLDKKHPYFEFSSKTGIEFFTSNNPKIILKRLMTLKRFHISKEKINWLFNNKKFILDGIYKNPIQRIDDSQNELVNHYTMSNYNITAQEGLFVLNVDPFKPLEEAIFERIDTLTNTGYTSIEVNKSFHRENFICYDIHKKFRDKIIAGLESENANFTKDTMEPDFKKLKEKITFEKIAENI